MVLFNNTNKTKPKILINLGCLMDIPTASLITGAKGETIINGGLGQITGIVGAGNNYKSTILHYMMLSAADKVYASTKTEMITYDTEVNIHLDRLNSLASQFENVPELPATDGGCWNVSDKSTIDANEWAVKINQYAEEKAKDKDSKISIPCFKDPYSSLEQPKPLDTIIPSFVEIDSLSEFEGSSTVEMLQKDLDSSETNTFAMKQALFKSKLLSTLPRTAGSSNIYFLLTAHVGEKVNIATGPAMYNQPTKKLQYLKTSDNIKGVSGKFNFLTNVLWMANTASVLKNNSTGLAEYPSDGDDKSTTDLNIVRLTQLRNKSGASGNTISVIVSQSEGVLPSLSEFHFIKENGRYGLEGNNTNYNLVLLPDVKLQRTTIRRKLEENKLLRRAVNILAELAQLEIFFPELRASGVLCDPATLYKDIKELGYDWNDLLNTRGYWLINQYEHPEPFLSTLDLLYMRQGKYHPYFYKKDSKTERLNTYTGESK